MATTEPDSTPGSGRDSAPITPIPAIGRIVHYQSYGTPAGEFLSEPRAAVITEVDKNQRFPRLDSQGDVGLCVLNPTGMFFSRHVPFSDEPKPGHWSWPPRV